MENNKVKEIIVELLDEELGDALFCTRTWSAWGVGTMSDADFENIDPDHLDEIAERIIERLDEYYKREFLESLKKT